MDLQAWHADYDVKLKKAEDIPNVSLVF